MELALVAALVALAALGAPNAGFIVPVLAAAPLICIELWFDMRSRSRRLLPELAGAVGVGSSVAAIVLLGGEPATLAVGLWVVVAARAVAAIPCARTQVLRSHGRDAPSWHSDAAQVIAVAAVTAAWLADSAPLESVVAMVAVAAFGVASLRRRPRRIAVVGAEQSVLGVVVVAATAVGVLT